MEQKNNVKVIQLFVVPPKENMEVWIYVGVAAIVHLSCCVQNANQYSICPFELATMRPKQSYFDLCNVTNSKRQMDACKYRWF